MEKNRSQPKTYYDAMTAPKGTRIQVHQGGTRSGKTFSLCQVIIQWCWENKNAGWVFTIVRKTMPALRASVMRDFIQILQGEGWYDVTNHNRSQNTLNLFGNLVEFISVDEPVKIRGRKRDVCYLNEANEMTLEDFRQLNLRTSALMLLDYNPSDFFSWIYDEVIPRDDCAFFQTTYKDNPYLDQAIVDEIERLKDTDENYWRIYGLGERGVNVSAVFPVFHEVDAVPEGATFVAYGLDFGFTNDPAALVAVWKKGHHLYVDELLYQTGLTNTDLADRFKGVVEGRAEVIADSAEPKSIEELYRHGYNVKPARKGRDSINVGIDILKRHKIHVTKGSTNLVKELRNYRWITDKNGRQINRPEMGNDHAIDALRYVCLNRLATNRRGTYYIA